MLKRIFELCEYNIPNISIHIRIRAIFNIRILFEYLDSKKSFIYVYYANIFEYIQLFAFIRIHIRPNPW